MRCSTHGSFFLCCSSHPHPCLEDLRKEVQGKVSTLRSLHRRPSTALSVWDHHTNELKVPENVPRLWLLDQGTDHILVTKFPHSLKWGGCVKKSLLEMVPGIFVLPSWVGKLLKEYWMACVPKVCQEMVWKFRECLYWEKVPIRTDLWKKTAGAEVEIHADIHTLCISEAFTVA